MKAYFEQERKCKNHLRRVVSCALALCLSADNAAGQLLSGTDKHDGVVARVMEPRAHAEELEEGFHSDVDSIAIAVGGYHSCALEYRPGVEFGGPVRCWGRDDWGQSSPTDDIFVQVRCPEIFKGPHR